MNKLEKFLVSPFIGEIKEDKPIVGLYGGGFKPPTKGHFEVVSKALNDYPEIEKIIIFVGGKPRGGISQSDAVLIWNIYSQYLDDRIEIQSSTQPIKSVYDEVKQNPYNHHYWLLGAREDNEDDLFDIKQRTKGVDTRDNLDVKIIKSESGPIKVSGTAARNALKNSMEDFLQYIPDIPEKEEIYHILTTGDTSLKGKPKENPEDKADSRLNSDYDPVAIYEDNFFDINKYMKGIINEVMYSDLKNGLKDHIISLTKYMIDSGLSLDKLPVVKFIDDDRENADDVLGKTAYYNPQDKSVTLNTLDRHPKDILRSFAHEMIHVHQDNENRLNGINTTNTNEDDYLTQIEREAYELGNITFRNWEDGYKKQL